MSLREVCRRLRQMGCETRKGASYWYASTIRSMLDNPAYVGRATFGRSRFLPPRPRLRPIRGHLKPSPRATSRVPVPREEWIEIPVPPLVDPTMFEAVRAQLEENRSRKRNREPSRRWLLQGLTVCQQCGYAYYGKMAPRSRKYDPANSLRYYRCTGADGYRFNGNAVCHNGPVRGDQLEQVVWDQVRSLLEEPDRVADEYRRRIGQAQDGAAMPDEIVRLNHQLTTMRRGIGQLIDSYAEGVIDKAEFEPRIAGLKQRLSQLQERHQAALEAAEIKRDLSLVISRLEDFSAKVTTRLNGLDQVGMQDIVRTLVRRIEIDESHIEVIFQSPASRQSTQAISDWRNWLLATLYRRSWSEPSLGSAVAAGSPRTGKTSIARRSPSYASLPSGSCCESYAIPHDVHGQTLSQKISDSWAASVASCRESASSRNLRKSSAKLGHLVTAPSAPFPRRSSKRGCRSEGPPRCAFVGERRIRRLCRRSMRRARAWTWARRRREGDLTAGRRRSSFPAVRDRPAKARTTSGRARALPPHRTNSPRTNLHRPRAPRFRSLRACGVRRSSR